MKTIITGGCGFIGSNLVDELINLNHEVIVIDNVSSDAHDQFYYNKKATYYKDDIINKHIVNGIFERHRPDYVFHLAAEARIQNCINDPVKAFNINTVGTQNILEASRMFNVKRVMFSSTSAIYGLNDTLPQKETLHPNCLNMYSYSKLFSEGLFKLYSDMYNVDSVCFRYFNVYGPRQPVRGSYAPVIGVFSRQLKNNQPMTVVGDGLQTRDYVHVTDIISANILSMTTNSQLKGEVFNIGTGVSYSVLEIAKMMGEKWIHIDSREGEARNTLADYQKAKITLNWNPSKKLNEYLQDKQYLL